MTWKYSDFIFRLVEKTGCAVGVKYLLPGEDLDPDSLITVSDDDDLQVGGSAAEGRTQAAATRRQRAAAAAASDVAVLRRHRRCMWQQASAADHQHRQHHKAFDLIFVWYHGREIESILVSM